MTTLDDINSHLLLWRKYLNELEIPFYLNASTALGIYRNDKLFENDRSIDLGVLEEDLTEEKLNILKTDSKYKYLKVNGSDIPKGLMYFLGCEVQPVYFKNKLGIYNLLDSVCLTWPEEHFKTWDKIEYLNKTWNIPHDVEGYFNHIYGDWKIPRSNWNWIHDAPNKINYSEI